MLLTKISFQFLLGSFQLALRCPLSILYDNNNFVRSLFGIIAFSLLVADCCETLHF